MKNSEKDHESGKQEELEREIAREKREIHQLEDVLKDEVEELEKLERELN